MLTYLFFLFHFTSFFISSNAQNSNLNPNPAAAAQGIRRQDPSGNFQPSLAVVVSLVSIILSLTCILLLYAKLCHRASASSGNPGHEVHNGLLRSRLGLDKTVIESLPFFRFSSLKGSRKGLECAVCLSKFEDIEVLRLLPKCKHAFHIDCIDQWLEKHSTCPLCRRSVTPDDVSLSPYSDSLRLVCLNQLNGLREESSVELYVEMEETPHGSSRFCIGSSFSRLRNDDDELPIHRKLISDVVFKSRWSSLTSSDIVSLKSEMLNQLSSSSFSSITNNHQRSIQRSRERNEQMMDIKEEMDRTKVREIKHTWDDRNSRLKSSDANHDIDKRSMSEITVRPRLEDEIKTVPTTAKEERMRMLWVPIARKTIHWVENRENRPPQSQFTTLNV